MNVELFANQHPLAYVHIAYAVVWLLQGSYAAWMVVQWRRLKP
jgi:hypothetical protein